MNPSSKAGLAAHWSLWGLLAVLSAGPETSAQVPANRPAAAGVLVRTSALASSSNELAFATGATNTSYVLSVNDLIKVEVYKEDDLRSERRVDQDGTISLPLIETVRVGGKTIAEARALIRGLYEKDFLVSAGVDITLVATSQTNKVAEVAKPKLKFTILGEVKKPGNIEMVEGEKLDLVQAIGMAEGFTGLANRWSVILIRNVNGKPEKYELDVRSMMQDSKAKPFEVKHGDKIEVRQTIF